MFCLTSLVQQAKILDMLPQEFYFLRTWLVDRKRWWAFFAVFGLIVLGFLFRCLHLWNLDYHYLLSPDSYIFHWVANRVLLGEGPPPNSPEAYFSLQSGMVYPLVYIAKGVSSVFNMSPSQTLEWAAKLIPPVLGIVTMLLIYFATAKIWDRRVALFSMFAWAFMFYAMFVGAGGYIDRDGLTILLLTIGALVFYISGSWSFTVRRTDIGWLVSGLVVLLVEVSLYLEWGYYGPLFLIAILVLYTGTKALIEFLGIAERKSSFRARAVKVIRGLNWRVWAVIIAGNLVAIGANYQLVVNAFDLTSELVLGRLRGESLLAQAAEMRGASFSDLVSYQLFIVFIVLGLFRAWKLKRDAEILICAWFVGFAILGLFVWRFLFYATPAACILAGIGLSFLWEWRSRGNYPNLKTLGVYVLLALLFFVSLFGAVNMSVSPGIAADKYWKDALTYLKQETPHDAVIMTQWSWGYWILDVGERRPFVDNGYYGFNSEKLRDIALAYATSDPSEAAAIMTKWGTEYLVFSQEDLDVAEGILKWEDPNTELEQFPYNSLVYRTLNGDFVSGGGLEVAYKNEEVVVLKLVQFEYTEN